jgi:hypothetical protein
MLGVMMMSISALSSNLITDLSQQQQRNPLQQLRQGFSQLANALQSGDLSGSQVAHSNLLTLLPDQQNGSTSGTSSTPANATQNDFAKIGQALQSGDIGQAQAAFSQIQKNFQAARQASSTAQASEDQYVPSTSQQQALSLTQQVRQDYAQLSSSLQAGDLKGAQSAFASLQQALQNQGTITQSNTAQGSPVESTPIQSLPIQSTPVQSTPVQSTPVQSTPVQSAPVQSAPVQSAPVQTSPIQSIPTPGPQSTTNSVSDTITNDFNALGSALSSGNLAQAQSVFSQLQNDIQTAQQAAGPQAQKPTGLGAIVSGHHHHHHHGGGGSNNQFSTSTLASPDSSTSGNTSSGISLYA